MQKLSQKPGFYPSLCPYGWLRFGWGWARRDWYYSSHLLSWRCRAPTGGCGCRGTASL